MPFSQHSLQAAASAQTPPAGQLASIHRLYASLLHGQDPDAGLGGQLLYAADLGAARALVAAANIAGAASLAAAADPARQRQAIREGIADFLVTTLDEALRILKNELRKRQPVAVAVSLEPETLAAQMLDRGVLPNLLPPLDSHSPDPALPSPSAPQPSFSAFLANGARRIHTAALPPGIQFLAWTIPSEFAQHPAGFDALLLNHLAPGDHVNRRWLRLSPRYAGSNARRLRSLACDEAAAARLIDRLGPPLEHPSLGGAGEGRMGLPRR